MTTSSRMMAAAALVALLAGSALWWMTSDTRSSRRALAPVPEPYIVYDAGVWRPETGSGSSNVLEILEAAPIHASLVSDSVLL